MSSPWTAPGADRSEPSHRTGERAALEEWLEYQRSTLLIKCAGLTGDQLAVRAVPPSTISLLGLVRHMSEVERWWLRMHVAREALDDIYCTEERPDADFDDADATRAATDLQAYVSEVAAARIAVAGADLDDVVASRGHKPENTRNVRWIYLHMIEEYARHNGHADLVRERVDGTTGD